MLIVESEGVSVAVKTVFVCDGSVYDSSIIA